ncbi:hypothetical protein EC973_008950 [Apophysomyces ossiformis]|uniref:BTB domain-containing protein n=1 Tax=Apophysomyces ossiformis TaxID=679940 RepID=A0A8H7EQN5_9FUNG|nr:hypothetical protein EC973_008950 [Apophysomyces ossiformis]
MPTTLQMQSISGIITQIHTTSGEVPPPLVGASVSVVGDQVFIFAGRLVTSRKMTNHMYVLDLNTLEWTRHIPPPDSDKPPKPRYFHSASVYGQSIVVFGGMGYSRVSADGLCVLDDVSIFDIDTMTWKSPDIQPSLFAPRPRYAHLSAVTEDKLIVVGGQDMSNNYLGEINVLDLKTMGWEQVKTFDKHLGAYRSIAIATPPGTRLPSVLRNDIGEEPFDAEQMAESEGSNHRASVVRQYGQSLQSAHEPSPIYLYTNYNFADVKRELQMVFSPASVSSPIEDCSSFMTGSVMPPGLRFPTGHTLGHHLILAGTYLSPQSQSYTIWALNLGTLTWSRIETGVLFGSGSWNRGVLHENTNRFLVFGHRNRSLLDDYNQRQVNFDHIAMVDLEAFGVYRLPKVTCCTLAQEMGLRLLNEPAVSDFTIITRENQTIPVNSAVLCQRWPYFNQLLKDSQNNDNNNNNADNNNKDDNEEAEKDLVPAPTTIKSHSMSFPYPYPVVIALLQFIYTDNLLTAQQYQPHILSQLLLLADMYDLPRLRELATHGLHQMLNMTTAPLIFETSALSHQTSLQIRALKMMIAAKKMIQQQQQQQQQHRQQSLGPTSPRQRTPSTPSDPAYSILDVPQVSPTSSSSSSNYQSMPSALPSPAISPSPQQQMFGQHSTFESSTRMSLYEQNHYQSSIATSPTLVSYRSRTPSLTNNSLFNNNNNNAATSRSGMSMSAATYGSMRTGSYSVPGTPPSQSRVSTQPYISSPKFSETDAASLSSGAGTVGATGTNERLSSSEPSKKDKSKKKKGPGKERRFLEAFGSKLSMTFQ